MATCSNCETKLISEDPADTFCRKCGQVVFADEKLEKWMTTQMDKEVITWLSSANYLLSSKGTGSEERRQKYREWLAQDHIQFGGDMNILADLKRTITQCKTTILLDKKIESQKIFLQWLSELKKKEDITDAHIDRVLYMFLVEDELRHRGIEPKLVGVDEDDPYINRLLEN